MIKKDPIKKQDKEKDLLGIAGSNIGLNMAVGMAVFTLLGVWIDNRRQGGIAFTISGIAIGLFYCIYEVWKLIKQLKDK